MSRPATTRLLALAACVWLQRRGGGSCGGLPDRELQPNRAERGASVQRSAVASPGSCALTGYDLTAAVTRRAVCAPGVYTHTGVTCDASSGGEGEAPLLREVSGLRAVLYQSGSAASCAMSGGDALAHQNGGSAVVDCR